MENLPTKVSDYLDFLLPGLSRKRTPLAWPPDVFGVVASLLLRSGAYRVAAIDWPPANKKSRWVPYIEKIGEKWRESYQAGAPIEVRRWWQEMIQNKALDIRDLGKHRSLCQALLQLLAAADEASEGAGVPSRTEEFDSFDFVARTTLHRNNGATLCEQLANGSIRVLPKMHVPQSGLTIRSFSKHLALIVGSEIAPKWFTLGSSKPAEELNLLLIPWPPKIHETAFKAVKPGKCVMKNLPRQFGFFEFERDNKKGFTKSLIEIFQTAEESVGPIDAVILPESSITDTEFEELNSILLSQGVYLIAGVNGPRNADGTLGNCVRYNIPLAGYEVPVRQAKHHRWKIDGAQIRNYRLEKQLNPKRNWWEHIPIEDRTLNFVAFRPWLAMCALICEDLARPDPVGDIIRAIGPNLVIALLLDGPQIPERWSARYATALTDDPGCSVLTLTSKGMAKLSRPRYKRGYKENAETIASWKDIRGSTLRIDLKGGEAAVLGIKIDRREEWTADGRDCGKQVGYPLLHWVHLLANGKVLRRFDLRE